MNRPSLSFVIPAKDEEKNIKILYKEIVSASQKLKKRFEMIFVDDGSTDSTFNILKGIHKKDTRVKIIKLRGGFGKSVALGTGFEKARGNIIFTLDADLQDNPADIPKFLKKLDEGYDLVSGWKRERHDPIEKRLPSRIGNWTTRAFTGIKIHDLNCGFKVYRREVVKNLNLYGELYKYIPVLALKQNFKVGEVVVSHRPRRFGRSKFGWERNIKGFLDMLTVVFLTGYFRRPGHFFGTAGIISFFFGFLIGIYITYLRITTGTIQYRHPLLFLGMLLMIIGIQLVSTGLLAEMITYSSQQKSSLGDYIEEILE